MTESSGNSQDEGLGSGHVTAAEGAKEGRVLRPHGRHARPAADEAAGEAGGQVLEGSGSGDRSPDADEDQQDQLDLDFTRTEIDLFRGHSGLLPAPDTFSAYEEIRPGTADQIVDWAERSVRMAEADVAADAEARVLTATANARVLTWVSPMVALLPYATLLVAVVFALLDQYVAAGISVIATAAMTALPKTVAAAQGRPVTETVDDNVRSD